MLGRELGGPGGAEILQAGFEAFDGEAHGAAAGKAELDDAGRAVDGQEADGEQFEDALAGVGVDAGGLTTA